MTGQVFDGRKAAEIGLVNEAVAKEKLCKRVRELADVLLEKALHHQAERQSQRMENVWRN
jgi:enoyl-CoA hydratase/carnithine racemase